VEFLLRLLDMAERMPSSGVSAKIGDLLRYIEDNLQRKLPLRELAVRAQLSLPRLKARFKQEVGIPPAEYVIRCKIALAQRRLAEPDVTITRVAMDLNFASSQYFATVFRRYTGQRPSVLRHCAADRRN
jgi:AraC-like DNA-binding protein